MTQGIRVILLGTGSPITTAGKLFKSPDTTRESATTLVQAGSETILFDAGRGVVNRLSEAGISGKQITALFLTHFHSDHTVGIPDLWLTSRLNFAWGGRDTALEAWGPPGTQDLMTAVTTAFETDMQERPHDIRLPLVGHDMSPGNMIWRRNGVTVTAFVVEHGTGHIPAFGYRIDYNGRSVVLSGDTCYHDNVIKYGHGVDLLVHEVIAVRAGLLKQRPDLLRIFNIHTSPEQAGEIFTLTKPKLAAYTHLIFFGGQAFSSSTPAPTTQDLIRQTRKTYKGPLAVGVDLMSFDIGKGKVVVHRPPGSRARG
ncbi:MAG: MBL fold metallo-hydrolase [Xanthobacteraceae bacterium]